MNKKLIWLLVIIFPVGIVYCLSKALFGNNFPTFLGVVFAIGIGILLGIYLVHPEFYINIINWFKAILFWFKK